MIELLKNKRILVVVAHPDDELLGLGATVHFLTSQHKCEMRAVILGEGITSRADERDPKKWESELAEHRSNIHTAASKVGYKSVGIYDLPDNRFDSVALLDIVKIVEKEKNDFKPEVILTHHSGDLNIDHQRTHDAVITATRTIEGEGVKTVIAFETPSATEWNYPSTFSPNIFIAVREANLQAKIDGMESYTFEKRAFPHPRSGKALRARAEHWGAVSGQGLSEAFSLIRAV